MCAVCPKCKKKIEELSAYSEIVQTLNLGVNGNPEYSGQDYIGGYTGFSCPECYEKIFNTEEEAVNFLKDNDELQKLVKEKIKKDKKENANLS